ncbi:uncharacterized protein LOC114303894 [Camellia sinensis]|uniref:uncharacterized protein LOC114303894 n=1 Tax=Camellia sinensis TaxID=4442 RepID=UPI0010369BC5|nr:uncharacterized protein LOC114303894 [Camellia sinensis]
MPEKRGRIKRLLRDRHIDVAFLQETKKVIDTEFAARGLWGSRKMEFMSVDPVGTAGGLLYIWDPDVFQLVGSCCNRRFILLSGTLYSSFDCVLLNVYAPNNVSSRSTLWNSIFKLKESFPRPWCLAGDLNEIRHMGERVGCVRRDRGMRHLNEFIDKCELNDLPLLGRSYTWCNSQEAQKWSRIDRIMLSPEWLVHFKMKLWGLPRLISDHCPLLMMEDERDWGPKPFRFINAWTLHPNFSHFFTSCWENSTASGWAGFIIQQKFKHLKMKLKVWNTEVFGNITTKLKETEEELHAFDRLAEERGDKNTRFFHAVASTRHNRNMINSISINGVSLKEPSRVKHEVFLHFKKHFKEGWAKRPVLGGDFSLIEDTISYHLVSAFTEAEVWAAIKESDSNKAPGPDGFNFLGYQKFWGIMKK